MSTEQGNKLIAEFMGGTYIPKNKWVDEGGIFKTNEVMILDEPFKIKELKYHTSWDWLMPVVEKIEAIRDKDYGWFKISIHSNACDIHSKYLMADDKPVYMSDPNAILNTKIESTWYNIVEFIKWYNTQSK